MHNDDTLDWRVLDGDDWDEIDWVEVAPEASIAADDEETGEGRYGHVIRTLAVVLCLLVGLFAVQFWRTYRDGREHLRADIRVVMNEESWAWQRADAEGLRALLDPQADPGWRRRTLGSWERHREWAGDAARAPVVDVEAIALHGDVAEVAVRVDEPGVPWMSEPYRETRFYRRTGDRWVRTAPDAGNWGSARTLETDHFRFEFRQRDADTVAAVAAEIDVRYAELRRELGLDAPDDEVFVVEVVPRLEVIFWRFSDDRLTVPSPVLQPVPVEVNEADYLADTIARPLAQHVLNEYFWEHWIDEQWVPLAHGVRYWLWRGVDTVDRPSGWRYAMHQRLRDTLSKRASLRLADLDGRTAWDDSIVRNLTASTVVEYGVTAYGRDRLAPLLDALDEHESWETLVPAVFGVSAAEFEAGWRDHLAAEYGVWRAF